MPPKGAFWAKTGPSEEFDKAVAVGTKYGTPDALDTPQAYLGIGAK